MSAPSLLEPLTPGKFELRRLAKGCCQIAPIILSQLQLQVAVCCPPAHPEEVMGELPGKIVFEHATPRQGFLQLQLDPEDFALSIGAETPASPLCFAIMAQH